MNAFIIISFGIGLSLGLSVCEHREEGELGQLPTDQTTHPPVPPIPGAPPVPKDEWRGCGRPACRKGSASFPSRLDPVGLQVWAVCPNLEVDIEDLKIYNLSFSGTLTLHLLGCSSRNNL